VDFLFFELNIWDQTAEKYKFKDNPGLSIRSGTRDFYLPKIPIHGFYDEIQKIEPEAYMILYH
jgi:hypothetical protein